MQRDAAMKEALANQLRTEATTWQARHEQAETEQARRAAEEVIERRRTAEAMESEKFRLMGEVASALPAQDGRAPVPAHGGRGVDD